MKNMASSDFKAEFLKNASKGFDGNVSCPFIQQSKSVVTSPLPLF
jgi:hypothetical protein